MYASDNYSIFALYFTCFLGLIIGIIFPKFRRSKSPFPLPPGPKPHPLVGHTFQVPSKQVWKYFERLGRQYGPLVRLSLAGDELLILNDPGDAEELLNRRSHNYSSRKPLIYAGKHQSRNKRLVLLPYGPELKSQRASFHQMLQPRVVGSYEVIQDFESMRFVFDILSRPQEAELNAKRFAAATVFNLSYGKRLSNDDKDLKAVLAILENFISDCYPGAHLVDTFPILDKLPDFLAPWRAAARRKHEIEMELYTRLLKEVKERMDSGDNSDCFAARLWQDNEGNDLDVESLAYIAGSAFEAGTDTTAASLLWFIMAMILYPESLQRARAELDTVLGADGHVMPGFTHINDLPYSIALTKEVFRWMPAAPGGFPHYSDQDDVYKGYTVKAKTMVIPNIWAMQHNEEKFPNPLVFDPDRFMRTGSHAEHDSLTEGHYGFGFGRRICPGRHLGAKTVWIGIVRMIWAFDIGPCLDSYGNTIPVDPNSCTSGITCKPKPFACSITPRSEARTRLIRETWSSSSEAADCGES